MAPKQFTATVLVEALCPCGKTMSVVRADDGRVATCHEEPACAAFLSDRPPDEYLREVRAFQQRRAKC